MFLVMLLSTWSARAQLYEIPISPAVTPPQARVQELPPITLPFFDDFSTSTLLLDTAWWMPASQSQVLVRPGNGILPPTLNVVTFDGVNANGTPYSPTSTDGPADSLLSRYIDLTQVAGNLRESVYLSFFYQFQGLGNQPDPGDSLILYFRKADSTWQKMWPLAGNDYVQDPSVFTEVMVKVPNSADFFHDHFQFKFQSFGRQNGWYDNWNLDYIYMDKRRSAGSSSYLDRAFAYLPSSILFGYTAMPFNEFISGDVAGRLRRSSTWLTNLENDLQPVSFTCVLRDTLNNVTLDTLTNQQGLVLFAKDKIEVQSNKPDATLFDPNADSLFLEITFYADTGDKLLVDSIYNAGADTAFYDHINLRVNDTVRSYVALYDYMAYDDGSAEYGAGINQKDGRIAYMFYSSQTQYIDRVDMYFPNIGRDQEGSPLEIYVLKELKDVQNPFLGLTTGAIRHEGVNKFVSYKFSESIAVQDTFYIGFRNLADNGLWTAIGLDKNTDSGDKIYYSVDGSWQQNTTIRGSLMIRPHFTDKLVTGLESAENPAIEIFPNPATGFFYIKGNYDHLQIIDSSGRQVAFQLTKSNDSTRINLLHNKPGLLIVLLEKAGQLISRKVIISP